LAFPLPRPQSLSFACYSSYCARANGSLHFPVRPSVATNRFHDVLRMQSPKRTFVFIKVCTSLGHIIRQSRDGITKLRTLCTLYFVLHYFTYSLYLRTLQTIDTSKGERLRYSIFPTTTVSAKGGGGVTYSRLRRRQRQNMTQKRGAWRRRRKREGTSPSLPPSLPLSLLVKGKKKKAGESSYQTDYGRRRKGNKREATALLRERECGRESNGSTME